MRESVGQEIECASDREEINNWFKNKKTSMRVIQDKIDYHEYDQSAVKRQNELYTYSIPIDPDQYSDVGYRFRSNRFLYWDNFAPRYGGYSVLPFFDFKFFNLDSYKVNLDINLIAEIYFRLEIDEIIHYRDVGTFFDWLEAIGGIPEILKLLFNLVIGTYLTFHSTMMNLKTLYKVESEQAVFKKDEKYSSGETSNEQLISLSFIERFWLYFFTESNVRPLCLCRSKKMQKYVEVYDKGVSKMEEEYDMLNFAQSKRDILLMKEWISDTNKHLFSINAPDPFEGEANDSDPQISRIFIDDDPIEKQVNTWQCESNRAKGDV